ncbi:sugar kinase [Desulfitobacterium hafniense]|uniref:Carbohydrate kinase PfkB domain-containing protein n=1 Tax=Desulfitobacterium hafniense (strain Y51) TaxID=138119 RepID=Q24S98_DESHY|nr:sugar kinase [Desulfitobacterium hafniense]BAE85094.1 hypothetical protein DSY3305 [Desulfitobacterium hafniense Y51]
MPKVVTFGELMLRLSPPGYLRFVQTDSFSATFGGSEANVAVTLAQFGLDVSFITKLPSHEIGQLAVNSMRRYGVDTSHILRDGSRIGVFYLEKGASQRGSKVIYDRENSAIALAKADEFNWEEIFMDAEWFHFSGISPALGDNMANLCRIACKKANSLGIPISCDLNYRKKLWTREQAHKVMTELMEYVDVCIANEEDAEDVFGIKPKHGLASAGVIDKESYQEVARMLVDRFGLKLAAITLRRSFSATHNQWSSILYNGKEFIHSKSYDIHLVDRVGGGDSFSGALLYGILEKFELSKALDFATAASCLQQTIEGDFNLISFDEVLSLVEGNTFGRVNR